jgi:beta-lactamase superfamily II metal-dependent hydrolase
MSSDLRVRVLDVGQGDAIVGLLPDMPRAFVTDVYQAEPVLRLLETEGIQEVLLYLSHSDRDHTRGAIDLLNNFRGIFQGIYFNHDRSSPGPSTEYVRLCRAIGDVSRKAARGTKRNHRFPLTTQLNEDPRYLAWFGSSVRVVILHPAPEDLDSLITQGKNEISGVLLVEHHLRAGIRRTLLAADVQLTGISLILDRAGRQPILADVLKFPHHGAWPDSHPGMSLIPDVAKRTMADFLTAVAPRTVVLSAGFSNPHGHVKPEVFDARLGQLAAPGRLTGVLCTQFTQTCLGSRVVPAVLGTSGCAGDVEIRTGESVSDDGLAVSAIGGAHVDRLRSLVAVGGTPRCAFLPFISTLGRPASFPPALVPPAGPSR